MIRLRSKVRILRKLDAKNESFEFETTSPPGVGKCLHIEFQCFVRVMRSVLIARPPRAIGYISDIASGQRRLGVPARHRLTRSICLSSPRPIGRSR